MDKILSRMRRAIEDYNMIEDGDRIAVGLSGGKDSFSLLVAISKLKTFFPKKFEIIAINLQLGFEGEDLSALEEYCEKNDIQFVSRQTHIGTIVFDIRNEKNPCSLCANMRRGALHNIALEFNCNKVALGHHHDDVIETLLLSLFYESRFHTFSPVTYLGRKNIYLIRPLIYCSEADIKGLVKRLRLPIVNNPCPANCKTKREKIKKLLKTLNSDDPLIKSRIFGAIKKGLPDWKVESD